MHNAYMHGAQSGKRQALDYNNFEASKQALSDDSKTHHGVWGSLLRLDNGISRMIMDGLKVFGLNAIAPNSFNTIQIYSHITD